MIPGMEMMIEVEVDGHLHSVIRHRYSCGCVMHEGDPRGHGGDFMATQCPAHARGEVVPNVERIPDSVDRWVDGFVEHLVKIGVGRR